MKGSRWDRTGLPLLTDREKSGMRDFWNAYETNYDAVYADLLEAVKELPDIASVVRAMTPEQLAEQDRISRKLMRDAVLEGKWEPLLENQRTQGEFYAAMNVGFREWFELISSFQRLLVPQMVTDLGKEPERLSNALLGMSRYLDIAMGIISEAYLESKERRIHQQQEAIQELSTPVLQVRERMLLLPIIGVIDTHRARLLTQALLTAIRDNRAKVVVVDITGVAAVDSKVANHLLQTVEASRLMGARVIVTGLSAEVAQTLVTLGVDLGKLNTVGDLQGGLEDAEALLGFRLVKVELPA